MSSQLSPFCLPKNSILTMKHKFSKDIMPISQIHRFMMTIRMSPGASINTETHKQKQSALNNVGQNSFQISAQLQSVLIVFNFIRPSVPCYVFLSGSKMFRPLVLRLFKCSFGYSCWPGWELRSIMTRLDKFMIPVPFLTTRFSMDCQ